MPRGWWTGCGDSKDGGGKRGGPGHPAELSEQVHGVGRGGCLRKMSLLGKADDGAAELALNARLRLRVR